ncbi:MAG: hypothetical protein VR72_17260 [Clostridiaceae bacterium BRH_c20a]|nr:MAG: hypothetical protein VR72_17260 [Clostridiaceae bacterium BRH_c20a]
MLEQLGITIKGIRESKGLTLKNVSEMSGLSIGFLSQIERSKTDPSIASLKKIAEAFKVKINDFFEKVSIEENIIIKKSERSKLFLDNSKVVYELLSPIRDRKMEPILKTIGPNATSGRVDGHEGEEFAFVLAGKLEISLGEKTYDLEEGDSVYFDASQPHSYRNREKENCVCIWVVTPPTLS